MLRHLQFKVHYDKKKRTTGPDTLQPNPVIFSKTENMSANASFTSNESQNHTQKESVMRKRLETSSE